MNKNPHLRLRAYDYSSHAVKLVQVRPPLRRIAETLTSVLAESRERDPSDRQYPSRRVGLVVRSVTRGFGARKRGHCSPHLRPQRAAP